MNTNKRRNTTIYKLCVTSLIAAIYTVVSLLGATYSFSNIQIRFAEILCLLPIIFPWSIWGVTLGCFLTNMLGVLTSVNVLGVMDMIFGTAATLIAACLTYLFRNVRYRNIPWLSALCPVIVNGVIIGLELTYVFLEGDFTGFPVFAAQVAIGEFIACVIFGLPIIMRLEKSRLFR